MNSRRWIIPAILVISTIVWLGCVVVYAKAAPAKAPTKAEFKKVADKYKCGSCHKIGDYGKGKHDLSKVGKKLSIDKIKKEIAEEKTHAFKKKISKSEIVLLAKYLSQLK